MFSFKLSVLALLASLAAPALGNDVDCYTVTFPRNADVNGDYYWVADFGPNFSTYQRSDGVYYLFAWNNDGARSITPGDENPALKAINRGKTKEILTCAHPSNGECRPTDWIDVATNQMALGIIQECEQIDIQHQGDHSWDTDITTSSETPDDSSSSTTTSTAASSTSSTVSTESTESSQDNSSSSNDSSDDSSSTTEPPTNSTQPTSSTESSESTVSGTTTTTTVAGTTTSTESTESTTTASTTTVEGETTSTTAAATTTVEGTTTSTTPATTVEGTTTSATGTTASTTTVQGETTTTQTTVDGETTSTQTTTTISRTLESTPSETQPPDDDDENCYCYNLYYPEDDLTPEHFGFGDGDEYFENQVCSGLRKRRCRFRRGCAWECQPNPAATEQPLDDPRNSDGCCVGNLGVITLSLCPFLGQTGCTITENLPIAMCHWEPQC